MDSSMSIENEAAEAVEEVREEEAQGVEGEAQDEQVEVYSTEEELDPEKQQGLIEALVFAFGEPITVGKLAEVSGLDAKDVKDHLETIEMKFALDESGMRLVCISGKYQFRTKGEYGAYIQKLKVSKPKRLTPAALETLAIVAYRQPIVKADVEMIRGVDCTPTLKTLLDRGILRIVGHKATVGQPALYGTTEKFLSIFGLSSLDDLPSLRELKELEEDPGEPEESEEEEMVASEESDSSEEQESQDAPVEEEEQVTAAAPA